MKLSPEHKKWFTTKEAAEYLGITPGGVRNRVWRGQLFPKKYQGRLYFDKSELNRLIEYSCESEDKKWR